jgi:signal transduction histidine kinase
MDELWKNLFSSSSYMPHGHCYLWNPVMLAVQVLSNAAIGLAYVAISSTLAYLVYRLKHEIPFRAMYLAFGGFIVLCGVTHFFDVYVIWQPVYWLDGTARLATAAVSVATALLLPGLVPDAQRIARGAAAARERGVELESAVKDWQDLYARVRELEQRKSEYFANLSHELRTPLTLIRGPLERMLAESRLPEGERRDLELVLRNARILHKHVDDLLDAAKLEAGEMKADYAETDVARVVRGAAASFEFLAEERAIAFVVSSPEVLSAQVDPEKLLRVVQNLLSNAFKFTPVRGRIRCAISLEEAAEHRGERRVVLCVADSGPGVPPEHRAAIFERFRQLDGSATRAVGGTGLGLAITRDLVALHGGRIEVSDAPEGGALFRVELPASAPEGTSVRGWTDATGAGHGGGPAAVPLRDAQLRDAGPACDAREASGLTHATAAVGPAGDDARPLALIVEDNADMRAFVAAALAATCRTETAADGKQGFARAMELRPDAIITDVMMPRMSGDELLQSVRANPLLRSVPVIVLTAKADDALRVRMLRGGAQDYLTKPFSGEELRARVSNLIEMKRAQDLLSDARITAEAASRELEALGYSIAHNLRAPLRSIDGFSQLLLEQSAEHLDDEGVVHVGRIRQGAQRMAELIDDLLLLIHVIRSDFRRGPVDLSALARSAGTRLQALHPGREIELCIQASLAAAGDVRLLGILFDQLMGNAWKFTAGRERARIEFGAVLDGDVVYHVRDDGAGFDMAHQAKLFGVFDRLHPITEFEGNGVGLAAVKRIVERHGGRIWAEGEVGRGATFYFTLAPV